MRAVLALALCALLALPAAAAEGAGWLPPEARERIAQVLAAKIAAAAGDRELPGDPLAAARAGVAALAGKIESLGAERLIELAPTFPELELPAAGDPHVDAIAAYGGCSFPPEALLADPSPREGVIDQRLVAATMTTYIVVISAYLRDRYLAAGTTDAEAGEFLAGDELNAVWGRVQQSEELMQHAMDRCAEALTEVMK